MSAVAAVYAAIQSRRANNQSAQALEWEQSRFVPDVRLEVEHKAETGAGILNPNNPRPLPKHYALIIHIVNHGETREQIRSLMIRTADGAAEKDITRLLRREVDLEPHADRPIKFMVRDLPESKAGYVVTARLARGTEVVSQIQELRSDLIGEVDEHNARAGYGRITWSKFGRI